ncbi:MAG: hypothetical protein AAGF67_13225, partial [Verrucomicrobiota bacterium]
NQARMERRTPEPNFYMAEDLVALIDASPGDEIAEEGIKSLGTILRASLERGGQIEEIRKCLLEGVEREVLVKREVARILKEGREPSSLGPFLPELEDAIEDADYEALILLSSYLQARYREDPDRDQQLLLDAWNGIQAILAAEGVDSENRTKALQEAVALSRQLDEEKRDEWFEVTFRGDKGKGRELLKAVGSSPGDNLQNQPTDIYLRTNALRLQSDAVETLLKVAPELATEWQETLSLLGNNWYREAEFTDRYEQSYRGGFGMRRDRYGNYFYPEPDTPEYVPNRVIPIESTEMLELQPSEEWLALIDKRTLPNFQRVLARLHLKSGNDEEAFPLIEALANEYPDMAEDLVSDYLRIWTENHDPNASQNRRDPYMFMYGYEQRAEGIPLTRSKQERNLEELSEVVKRLRSLPLERLDETLLVRAFTTSHSRAEVYRTEAIEKVFGSLDQLKPDTIASLAQTMRGNLAGVWRNPAEQKKAKTNRKQRDIQIEVVGGYDTVKTFLDRGLEKHPDAWQLHLAKATTAHDENNFLQSLVPDSEFTEDRKEAFTGFQKAADLYVAGAGERKESKESNEVFDFWFYASLGASDLSMIGDSMVADRKQPAEILKRIEALPGEQKERHLERFANNLFSRMSSVAPAVKYQYLRSGFEIVGDHESAAEAKEVFDYYKDLVTEIQLETVIDGSDRIGHESPFGLFVNIKHTREIERESGGFKRYLQNQNNRGYYYNYGRPLENYRDKFEEIVLQSLSEEFEIQSVTFQSEDVNSRAVEPYGWRVTPYAYILLKAKGPEVDRIGSLRLDLDFLDTSGYAVLPIESPELPVDASDPGGEPRPIRELDIVQTLDERQFDEGKLLVEVNAKGLGIVPALEDLLVFDSPGFEIAEVRERGLSVAQFDQESDGNVVLSERDWIVELMATETLEGESGSFTFASAVADDTQMTFQRYVDADLAGVAATVSLEEEYSSGNLTWVVWAIVALLGCTAVGLLLRNSRKEEHDEKESRFRIPEPLTPFTVIGLLQEIDAHNGLNETQREELRKTVGDIEEKCFGKDEPADAAELKKIATNWIDRTAV